MRSFIHLVESPKSKAFYDVNTNSLVRVGEATYSVLRDALDSDKDCCDNEYVKQLMEKGYLSDKRVEVIEHGASKNIEDMLSRKLSMLTLQVTQGCNLRCAYCLYSDTSNRNQRTHSDRNMTFETACRAVDYFIAHSADTEEVSIGFYGGEPVLRIKLVMQVVEYIKREYVGKKVTFTMTTNATLLNDEVIEFLAENEFAIIISLDGPEDIHNMNRRYAADNAGSYRDVIKNVNKIIERNKTADKKLNFSVNMVMTPQFDFMDINGLYNEIPKDEKLTIRAALVDDTFSIKDFSWSDEFREGYYYEQFLALVDYFGLVQGLNFIPFMRDSLFTEIESLERYRSEKQHELPEISTPGGPCIPGQRRLFVNVDGDFYPCERVSESSDIMKIGSLDEGIDVGKCLQLLNFSKDTEDECRNCWSFLRCDLCARAADAGNGLSAEHKLKRCGYTKRKVHETLRLELLREDAREFLIKEKAR